jgi:hypothetical protein
MPRDSLEVGKQIPIKHVQSARLRVAESIYINGPMTSGALVQSLRHSLGGKSNIYAALEGMREDEQVLIRNDMYHLSEDAAAFIADRLESHNRRAKPQNLVPPRTPPTFKPMNSKYIPSALGTRPDAPQRAEHRIITIGGVQAPIYWDDGR